MTCYEDARKRTLDSLLNDLPGRIYESTDGFEFGDFFAGTTNETPATSDFMKDALAILRSEGAIEIRTNDGLRKRSGIRHRTDIIKPTGQRSFFIS